MAVKGPRRRKFAELVADHVLGAIHRDELVAVVNGEGQRDHIRRDHRAPRPSLDDTLVARGGCGADFFFHIPIHRRTFFPVPFPYSLTPSLPAPPDHHLLSHLFLLPSLS